MVRVRFAPSPTGYLHIGGARTALYNYLFAKATGGKCILRIEDTDLERSSKEYEHLQIADLKWLGIEFDEGPVQGGQYGPYRQSERLHLYQEYAQKLIETGQAYYDFCTDQELAEMRELALKENRDPHYQGKWRETSMWPEAQRRVANGEKAAIRFKVRPQKIIVKDHVRGEVEFPENMVGDFIILRANGLPTYNFCNVIDDHLQEITHILRGEDHLNNTVRQLMIYQAYTWQAPEFAHLSLLIGKDRQKLSKRHGATSVHLYKEQSYQPQALTNYLCLLGWSHPNEVDIFTNEEVSSVFSLDRFSRAPAIYDIDKLNWVNGQHLRALSEEKLFAAVEDFLPSTHYFHKQEIDWKRNCLKLFIDKIQRLEEFPIIVRENLENETFEKSDEIVEVLNWETTPKIIQFLKERLESIKLNYINAEIFNAWMEQCKNELNIKGKPLFMGFRVALTGQNHGPDLKLLIPLTPTHILKKRLEHL